MAKKTTKKKKAVKPRMRKPSPQSLYGQYSALSGLVPPTFPQPQRRDVVGQKKGFDGFVRPDLQLYNYDQAVKAQNQGNSVLARQFLQSSGLIPSLGANVVQPQPPTQIGFGPSTQNFTPQGLGSNSVNPAVYAQGSLLGTPGRLGTLQAQGRVLGAREAVRRELPPPAPRGRLPAPPPGLPPRGYAPPGSVGGVGPTYGQGGGFAPLRAQSQLRGVFSGPELELDLSGGYHEDFNIRSGRVEELGGGASAARPSLAAPGGLKGRISKALSRFSPRRSDGAMAKKRRTKVVPGV